jgi:hypothetical protein
MSKIQRRERVDRIRRKQMEDLWRKKAESQKQMPRLEFSEEEFAALSSAKGSRKHDDLLRIFGGERIEKGKVSGTLNVLERNLKRLGVNCLNGVPLGGKCVGLGVPGGIRIVVEKEAQGKSEEYGQATEFVEKSGGTLLRLTPEQAAKMKTAKTIKELCLRYKKRR